MQVKKQQLEHEMEPTDWFKIGKGVCQGCILSPCLFNLYAEYIMQNAGLDESQAGINMAGRNNNPRYADDTTLMAESKEEVNSLLMRVKEESEKAGLNPNIQKLRLWHLVPSLPGKQKVKKWKKMTDFLFLDSQITAAMKLKDACSSEERL